MNELVWTIIEGIFFKNPIYLGIVILGFLSAIFYKKIAGYMGEFWVKTELRKLPKDKYLVLNDVMVKSNKGTHQIDHIVISEYGIFVIEMKNYDGLITGDEYKRQWTQHFGKNKYYFNNPIHQNYGHIKALEELLKLEENKFISIVCISNRAKLKVKAKNVIQLDFLNDLIFSYEKQILDCDLNELKQVIQNENITDKVSRKNHVKNIRNNINENKEKENNKICPKCGGKLVERKGKYGEFIGCSNYPKCRFTIQKEENKI